MASEYITVWLPTSPNRETVQELLFKNRDLEELLDNIFTQKLAIPYNHREVIFVQTAIEKLVLTIVYDLIENKDTVFIGETELEVNNENVLCKIGSFYEQTKNTYPDEFDFVYVPFRCCVPNDADAVDVRVRLNPERLQARLDSLLRRQCLSFKDDGLGEVQCYRTFAQHGDITTLEFFFNRSDRLLRLEQEKVKHIYVDLIPGIRIIDPNLTENVRKLCCNPGYQEHILETASMQYIACQFSGTTFCEAEVDFMQRVLTTKHLKVYRLLKYLINGGSDAVDLTDECTKAGDHCGFGVTSYALKTAMIRHHYECPDDSDDIARCILGILKWFLTKFSDPVSVLQTESGPIYQVQVTDLTNQKIVLASGHATLLKDAERCLEKLIEVLENYRKKEMGHVFGVASFASRMTERVKKYELDQQPINRLARQGGRCLQGSGSCCYKLIIIAIVLLFAFGLIFGMISRK